MGMHAFHSVDQVLEAAIHREAQASEFYLHLASMVESVEMSRVLENLASEEVAHMAKLEAIRDNDERFCDDIITNTGVADHLAAVVVHSGMSYTELLLAGIQKEDRSYRLYQQMARAALDEGVRNTFLRLAQEESEHKLRFEIEYELLTFRVKKPQG